MVEALAAAPRLEAPAGVSAELAIFLKLLADPTRRRIFLLLMQGETCNCEITGLLGLPQNLISHHLRQLREGGLVRSRRDENDARWIYYRVDPDALATVSRELGAVFSPAALRERQPRCGPILKGCAR